MASEIPISTGAGPVVMSFASLNSFLARKLGDSRFARLNRWTWRFEWYHDTGGRSVVRAISFVIYA